MDGWSRETSNEACAGAQQSKADKSVNVMSNITCGKHGNITEFIANDTLTCIYTNIDGLNCIKGSELNIVIQQESPDIVFVTETKLSAKCIVTQYVDCAEYNIFRKDRHWSWWRCIDYGEEYIICDSIVQRFLERRRGSSLPTQNWKESDKPSMYVSTT